MCFPLAGEVACRAAAVGQHSRTARAPSCKIFSLDLGDLKKASDGSPAADCDVHRDFTVNDFNGVSYLTSSYPKGEGFLRGEHLTQSQHAGPWFLHEALTRGAGAANIEVADKVLVNDYCFFMWWLSYIHTFPNEYTWPLELYPGSELVTLYHSLLEHPRWRRNNGADFVFFWPHPGIGGGPAQGDHIQLICEAFAAATFIVIERMQRFRCSDYRKSQVIVAPYSSNSKYQLCPVAPVHKDKLLFYKGRCTPPEEFGSEGVALRHEVVTALPVRQDVTVECSDSGQAFEPASHSALLEDMSRHKFCLVIPGDTSSSRRLSDAMLAKCMPVFVGPPFHTLPLTEVVDYASFAVFLNITSNNINLSGDNKGKASNYMWKLDSSQPKPVSASQSQWWVPDVDMEPFAVPVTEFRGILSTLERIPTADVEARQISLQRYSAYFQYKRDYAAGHSATKSLIDLVCAT